MRTDYKADDTVLSLLDYTTPSLFDLSDDLSPMDDQEAPEFPWAQAWSSSPLGDPGVDDDDPALVDEYGPEAGAARTPVAALAAAALGALGFGVLVGVAVVDFAATPAPLPTVAIAAHSVPAPPKMMMSTAPSTTAAPSPTSVPAATTVPGPSSGPTFQVLPCIPMPFCV
ncbi:MAG: hypothetical protein U0R66_00265 [Mycobacterium sp.]